MLSWHGVAAFVAAVAAIPFVDVVVLAASTDDSAIRINLAGRQRMLSQRMAKSACFVAAKVEVPENIKAIEHDYALFDTTLKGLLTGSETLGLQAERDEASSAGLETVATLWGWFGQSLTSYVKSTSSNDSSQLLDNILTSNLDILLEIDNTVTIIQKARGSSGQIAPELAQAINVAGRQRMLSQKMAKEVCMLSIGIFPDETRPELGKTLALFERSQDDLSREITTLPISAEARVKIIEQNVEIGKKWKDMRTLIAAAADGKSVSQGDVAELARNSDTILRLLNDAVSLYQEAAKSK